MNDETKVLAKGTKVWIVYPFCSLNKEYERQTLQKDCFLKGKYISISLEEAQKGNVSCEAYLTKKEAVKARFEIRNEEIESLKNQMIGLSLRLAEKQVILSKLYKESM